MMRRVAYPALRARPFLSTPVGTVALCAAMPAKGGARRSSSASADKSSAVLQAQGCDVIRHRVHSQFDLMQDGLVYSGETAIFTTFAPQDIASATASTAIDRDELAGVVSQLAKLSDQTTFTSAVIGVSFGVFKSWCRKLKVSPPAGMAYINGDEESTVFRDANGAFVDSRGAVWVHVKSDTPEGARKLHKRAVQLLQGLKSCPLRVLFEQECNSRTSVDKPNGGVLGCRFAENVNNPADPITLANHTIVGAEDPAHMGGSFVFSQRFRANWEHLHNMSEAQIEDVIGRTTKDVILPGRDSLSHIVCSRSRDLLGNTTFILRLGMPFGESPFNSVDIKYKGGCKRDEEGVYFAGFAKSAGILEAVLKRQIGSQSGFMRDRLFSAMRSDGGGFFYVPSKRDLFDSFSPNGKAHAIGAGINWKHVARHNEVPKGPNGLMHFNHKQYLFDMSVCPKGMKHDPPSYRVLSLMMDSFARWQDTWYFPKGQLELGHLEQHLGGADAPASIMSQSVAIRRAWAIRMTLRVLASKEFGCRGPYAKWSTKYKAQKDLTGTDPAPVDLIDVEGADTFRINPLDFVVGAMPDLTLAQGFYVMQYLRDEERMSAFTRGLSEASGVGHIVPDFDLTVKLGIKGIIDDLAAHKAATKDAAKKDYYESCIIAFEGIRDYLRRYSSLALEMSKQYPHPEQTLERENLLGIAKRLNDLCERPAQTLLEGAQIIFTVFTCLHHTGEVVALGRLDQYLDPLYRAELKKGTITPAEAQEIIDSFCIKLDEKVLQNRLFVQDHQTFGNLAMGGASGPYPQGASMGQWIQQVTVGGVVADDSPKAKSAYNDVTKFFLRSATRLPLNAPCLSLRVDKNTPEEYLREASKAILSGGAHPILLNDDKMIPAMQGMGEGIGGALVGPKAGGKWRSKVDLKAARNYACDGCYEPMIVGENWFSLGGFTTLQPLECALNEGRTYGSAGPVYFLGQTISFRTLPPTDITSFEQLLSLYFLHFEALCTRALGGQLGTFDALYDVCPAPLLSPLVRDCTAKGLDLYQGGARYNIYGPCFIALSSTVNSLFAINKMVFDPATAVTSLPELVQCLMCDWGNRMDEPFISSLAGSVRTDARAQRFKQLRDVALQQDRYGLGSAVCRPDYETKYKPHEFNIAELGNYVIGKVADTAVKVFKEPLPSVAATMLSYAEKYGTKEYPFGFQIQPGSGTFENFVQFGVGSGASADGRRANDWIASDLTAAPSTSDASAAPQANFESALAEYSGAGPAKIWDGAPTDLMIDENVAEDRLTQLLKLFAEGQGSNILTVTTANLDTMKKAVGEPERYDCLRVRMGGWTEFFTTMFPANQQQFLHRPRYSADKPAATGCPFSGKK